MYSRVGDGMTESPPTDHEHCGVDAKAPYFDGSPAVAVMVKTLAQWMAR
jgi:hypothetical protein